MAWTTAESKRVIQIEEEINNLATAVGNLMAKKQFSQLLLIKQREIDALTLRVTALEAQLEILQNRLD